MSGNDVVLTERRDHVLVVTLNRPEVRNAVNMEMSLGVAAALAGADVDPSVRVVIITGAGDKAFCAGADLKALARGERLNDDEQIVRYGFAGFVRHHVSKPVIAAVNGFALGGGTEIVLQSDLAVAVESAELGLTEVRRGIFAGAGGVFRLGRQIPPKIASEIILTGRPIAAARALELGLINRVVPDGCALEGAMELAALISENAPLAVQGSKRVMLGIEDGIIEAEEGDWRRSIRESAEVKASKDAAEGAVAFAEKRAPHWTGE